VTERDTPAPVILLVDDNPADELLTLRAFRKCGFANRVVVARDGQETLDYLFGASANSNGSGITFPRVVLLDLGLPRVSGWDVLRRIRAYERTRSLQVFILTSANEDLVRQAGDALGASGYVHKTIDCAPFLEVSRRVGLSWPELHRRSSSASQSRDTSGRDEVNLTVFRGFPASAGISPSPS
jgi:two-component system, response regulator